MGMQSIMCVPVLHLFLISQHERNSHQKKRNNNHFPSDMRSMILTLYVTVSSPHHHFVHPTSLPLLPSIVVCFVICGSLFYALTALSGLLSAVVCQRRAHKL